MEKKTLNKLKSTVQEARGILEREATEQLQGDMGISSSGIEEDESFLKSDDARQRRRRILERLRHMQAKDTGWKAALETFIRSSAFTTLNRLLALRMLEARGFTQQCVSKGDESEGFQEFKMLAPGLSALGDYAYRLYLECLCDELSTEIGVLFDRSDPTSLIWPRRPALTKLLELLADSELANVWEQDETIGWAYQFFNGDEERKQMRKHKIKDSHELAVRNQFFTPRYVVRFLTENTLGRIWYEMRKGETLIKDSCDYLVARKSERFLEEGEEAPELEPLPNDATVEQALEQPCFVEHRPTRDPRDLRVIDPACGSGHFLLYCFDLLAAIYKEAWQIDDQPASEATGDTLREDYPKLDSLQRDIPSLILGCNLHGIEIDPRCAQIASLALWMKAQAYYGKLGLQPTDRPAISKTNIVIAEPMPGEEGLRQEMMDRADEPMAKLLESLFGSMDKADELGSLLKVEDELEDAIKRAYRGWGGMFEELDEDMWAKVRGKLDEMLAQLADEAQRRGEVRQRLFAGDAEQGIALIDLLEHPYDVALMNPPFGDPSKGTKSYLKKTYPNSKCDIYAMFVERWLELLRPKGMLGAITSRTGFFLKTAESWRKEVVLGMARPTVFADLGYGVLDAMVETAAYCLERE